MSHPFGDLLTQHLHRKHGLSQSKLAAGILQSPSIITDMSKGKRLRGAQARERVTAIIGWLQQQGALTTLDEANTLLRATSMVPLQEREAAEALLIRRLSGPVQTQPRPAVEALTAVQHSSVTPRHHNLPTALTPFIGRSEQIAQLVHHLKTQRLLTLTGAGGVGKTRLALAVAAQVMDRFADGVWFVDLAPLIDPEAIPQRILDLWRVPEQAAATPLMTLTTYLRAKQALLILDNCEHLIDACAALAETLLQQCPQLSLLATSREALNIGGETPWRVPSLTRPRAGSGWEGQPATVQPQFTPEALSRFEAVTLFVERAGVRQPGFALTPANAPAIAHICTRLDGIPLALEMAAARINIFTVEELAQRLDGVFDGRFHLLTSGARTAPLRHQTLRATLEWSYGLLTAQEQCLLVCLSVFSGGWNFAAAAEVTGCSLDLLAQLVNKSLVIADQQNGQTRYRLLETVRQFAAEQLAQTPTAEIAVSEQHCTYYCHLLGQQEIILKGAGQQEALAKIEANLLNMQSAWNWAVAHGQVERIAEALESLSQFYEWRRTVHEGEFICRHAVESLSPPISSTGARVVARLLIWQGVFTRSLGNIIRSQQLLQQSLAILDGPELVDQDRRAEKAFALLHMNGIDREETKQFRLQSLELYRAIDDKWGTALALQFLAGAYQMLGEHGSADQFLQESLKIREDIGYQVGIANSLTALGLSALDRGEHEKAEEMIRKSLAIVQKSDNLAEVVSTLQLLGIALLYAGKFDECVAKLEECLEIHTDQGRLLGSAMPYANLSNALLHLERVEQVSALLELALTESRKLGNQFRIGYCLIPSAMVALATEMHDQALILARESATIWQKSGHRFFLGQALALIGCAACELGSFVLAKQAFVQALIIGIKHSVILPLLYAVPGIALLFAREDKYEQAISIYSLASRHPHIANSHWFADIVGKPLAAAASALPPNIVTAAELRGRQCDLWETAAKLLAILQAEDIARGQSSTVEEMVAILVGEAAR